MKPWREMSSNDKWGWTKFTETKIWLQALNGVAHALTVAVPTYFWGWLGFALGEGFLLLRETVWQMVIRKGNPHILDRVRDLTEGIAGGALCFLVCNV